MDPAGFASLLQQELGVLEKWTDRLVFLMSILSDAQTNFNINVNNLTGLMSGLDAKVAAYTQATKAFDAKSVKSTTQLTAVQEGWRAAQYEAGLGLWEYHVPTVLNNLAQMKAVAARATPTWNQIADDTYNLRPASTILSHTHVDLAGPDTNSLGFGALLQGHLQKMIDICNDKMHEPEYARLMVPLEAEVGRARQSSAALDRAIQKGDWYAQKISNVLAHWYVFNAQPEAQAEEHALNELNDIFKAARLIYAALDQINDVIIDLIANISQALSGMAAVSVRLTETYNAHLGWYWTLPKTNTNAALLVAIVLFSFVVLLTIIVTTTYLGRAWMRSRQTLKIV